MVTPKLPADIMARQRSRLHQDGLDHGQVECHRCREIYPLGTKHGCKASEPAPIKRITLQDEDGNQFIVDDDGITITG